MRLPAPLLPATRLVDLPTARRLAAVTAAGRLALGVVALVRPEVPAALWIGNRPAQQRTAQVLARALGGRDLALAAGTLWRLRDKTATAESTVWVTASAIADGIDVLATLLAWRSLPKRGRLLVAAAAAGAVICESLAVAALIEHG